jgi:hypothetical protein
MSIQKYEDPLNEAAKPIPSTDEDAPDPAKVVVMLAAVILRTLFDAVTKTSPHDDATT